MALKFLNKKGWHTGSLRNIENVWKAEQKHDAEQKKLEELRKQIQEEREKSEFRLLQEQAGLVPRQERLDFLYDSGLACGKGNSDGFKALESYPKAEAAEAAPSSSKQQSATPGALFEDKPQSANDAWRKLHSDPLLLIRQREQEALARIKNNPVQMANIRKSVQEKNKDKVKSGKKKEHEKHDRKKLKHDKGQSSEDDYVSQKEDRKNKSHDSDRRRLEEYPSDGGSDSETERKRKRSYGKYSSSKSRHLEGDDASEGEERKHRSHHNRSYEKYSSSKGHKLGDDNASEGEERKERRRHHDRRHEHYSTHGRSDSEAEERRKRDNNRYSSSKGGISTKDADNKDKERNHRSRHQDDDKLDRYPLNDKSGSEIEEKSREKSRHESHPTQTMEAPKTNLERPYQRQRRAVTKLSEEEKADRLREMEMDAVLHEEQRWKRLKKASENDAQEASQASSMGGQTFLNAAQKSVYGAEKGGSSTIEESVRRRKYYSQGRSESNEGNAFRR